MRRLLLLLPLLLSTAALAQSSAYTPSAGQNAPAEAYEPAPRTVDDKGPPGWKKVEVLQRDTHGNAQGNQYDLAYDGAFVGETVLILDQVGNTLDNTKAALAQKGFNVVVVRGGVISPGELEAALAKSCQVWVLSNSSAAFTEAHIAAIKRFFDAGHGVYIWGDNDPYYVDANRLSDALIKGLRMEGDLWGSQVVNIADEGAKVGLRRGHLITTGLEHLYEGITIATIQFKAPSQGDGKNQDLYGPQNSQPNQSRFRSPELPAGFTPLLYGSAGNLVTVAYEKDGKRLVMDGGFTRLAVSWDDAGTARYVKNAAAWLVNSERFGTTVATTTQKTEKKSTP